MSAAVQPMPSPFSPTSSQIAVAYSVCRSITRSAAKNFYYAFLVLPHAKRQALCAVYAFMRRCDDIADDFNQPSYERRQRLEAWLDAFHRAESGHPTDDPVLLALTDTQRRFKVPVELLDQLAYGTGMDIQDRRQPSAAGQPSPRCFTAPSAICVFIAIGWPRWSVWSAFGYLVMRSRGRRAGGKSWTGFSAHQYHSRHSGRRRHGKDLSSRRRSRPFQDWPCGISPGVDSGAPALAAGGRSRPRP